MNLGEAVRSIVVAVVVVWIGSADLAFPGSWLLPANLRVSLFVCRSFVLMEALRFLEIGKTRLIIVIVGCISVIAAHGHRIALILQTLADDTPGPCSLLVPSGGGDRFLVFLFVLAIA